VTDPFEERDFDKVLIHVNDRELSEWIVNEVAASPPSRAVCDVPPWRPAHILRPEVTRRTEDASHLYLEAVFPSLTAGSIPALVDHVAAENDQLRAFIAWCLASLEYTWPDEQLESLLADSYWKVRLNALFVCDVAEPAVAASDDSVLQAVADAVARQQRDSR
jgi:hypothetical protein